MPSNSKKKLAVKTEATKNNILTSTISTNKNSVNIALVLLVFILPILISNTSNDPVIPLRFICLSIFCALLSIFLIFQFKKDYYYEKPKAIIYILVLNMLYASWSYYATSHSINPSAGYFDIVRFLLFAIFLIICYVIIKQKTATILVLCKVISIMGIVHSLIGISQYYGTSFLEYSAEGITNGLMANRTLFASAQALLLPFIFYALKTSNRIWRSLYIVSLFFIFYSLLLSQTRSAWLAVTIFIVITFFLIALVMRKNIKQIILYYGIGIVCIVAITFIVFQLDKNNIGKQIEQKLASSNFDYLNDSNVLYSSGAVRVGIWEKTNQLIKDYPISGVGLGNWKIKVRDYGSNGTTWLYGKTVPDRVHNVYLQIIAETGIVGAILYFSIWMFICYCAFSLLLKKDATVDKWLIICMLGGLTCFFVDCIFGFPTERIEHNVYFTLMASIILVHYKPSLPTKEFNNKKISSIFFGILALGSIFCIFIGFKKLNFETQLIIAKENEKQKNYDESIEAVYKGRSAWISINEDGKPLETYSSLSYMLKKDYPNAIKEGKIALQYNPSSPMANNNIGAVYANMGKYDSAIIYYKKAVSIAPLFEEPLKNIIISFYNLKQYDSCIYRIEHLIVSKDSLINKLYKDAKIMKEMVQNTKK